MMASLLLEIKPVKTFSIAELAPFVRNISQGFDTCPSLAIKKCATSLLNLPIP